ncbi:DoxX family protein [Streptomyces sp. NPDC048603]|uniref:DoxX family protein n=1 Tax=Streptomyces sp. NPDC048603 TaxID=3365577 RepID=UPI0037210CA1
MFIAFAVVSALLALALAASATLTFRRHPQIADNMRRLNVPASWLPRLAAVKAAGAIGLVAGLWVAPLGIAAAIGVVLFFAGAVITHLRAADREVAPAVVLGLLAGASLTLGILTT